MRTYGVCIRYRRGSLNKHTIRGLTKRAAEKHVEAITALLKEAQADQLRVGVVKLKKKVKRG